MIRNYSCRTISTYRNFEPMLHQRSQMLHSPISYLKNVRYSQKRQLCR